MSLFNFDQFRPISTNFSQFWPILAGRPVKIHFGRLFSNPALLPGGDHTQVLQIHPDFNSFLPGYANV